MPSSKRISKDSMKFTLVIVSVIVLGATFFLFVNSAYGTDLAAESGQHVVSANEIQAQIDQQVDQAAADRQAIQDLLQREDVRRVAGSAGLDLVQASAAAATLSGTALESLAAQARALDKDLVGGESKVVLTTTTIIIILLILILLT